jgi:Ca2+-binding EF-hand superfamily protein
MKTKNKKDEKNKERLEQAVYKFKFTKEQNRDLQTAFEIFDKDGTGNIDIKDLKVILRALGFEPQEDEIKKLLSTINRSDDEENNKKGFSTNTIDFEEFKKIMNNKLRESEEIESLRVGFFSFTDKDLPKENNNDNEYITLKSLRDVANELREVVNDEELKEMMVQANPELKNLINEGKGDDESIYKISQAQFNQLLDRIKSGN